MTATDDLLRLGEDLLERSGATPEPALDLRIDHAALREGDTPQRRRHVAHQALMRSYQGRYVLLPERGARGDLLAALEARYEPEATLRLDARRPALEAALLGPAVAAAQAAAEGRDIGAYVPAMLEAIRAQPRGPFLDWLDGEPSREHHFRNFLVQSSADLLAEASASALGVVGEFGAPQSALFRILIDEYGYGAHDKKHSVLYRRLLRGFGVDEEYNALWPLFDTAALALHNTIHMMFQSPRHLFRQIGFLLYAETSYQVSTGHNHRFLRRHAPQADATYFGEHAHIDVHHSQMVIDEVVAPLVARFGDAVGREVIVGAELTRAAFAAADAHLYAVSRAFAAAEAGGRARYGMAPDGLGGHGLATPDAPGGGEVWVGGLGRMAADALGGFPDGATGRRA